MASALLTLVQEVDLTFHHFLGTLEAMKHLLF